MYVITRHGASKPAGKDLLPFQEGYDTRDNVYGKHEGKEMFINDNGEIRSLNENYLKSEFVNYPLSCDEDGNPVSEGGKTVYTHDPKASGVLAHLKSSRAKVVDENGSVMAERVSLGAYQIDTKNGTFSAPNDEGNLLEVYSVSPVYLAQLKNSLEQKALYVVETKAELEKKVRELAEEKRLEPGVQIIVRHDESQPDKAEETGAAKNDTVIYVVTNGENNDAKGKLEIKEVKADDGSIYYEVTSEDGNFKIVQTITLEYLYHDPVAKEHYKGMGVEVVDVNDVDNTAVVGLTDYTVDTVEEAFNHGNTIVRTRFGAKDDKIPSERDDRGKLFLTHGAKYANFVEYIEHVYHPDGKHEQIMHYMNFSNFVLDEGTWDAPSEGQVDDN